jgi:hypothetical protein
MAQQQQRATAISRIGRMLHAHYSSTVEAPLPGRWVELAGSLEQQFYARGLSQADQDIAKGKRHVAEQRERVARMRENGLDTAEAERLLSRFEAILEEMLRHKAMILERMPTVRSIRVR